MAELVPAITRPAGECSANHGRVQQKTARREEALGEEKSSYREKGVLVKPSII
jgi:hypothetical protein